VDGSGSGYLKTGCDYVRLNPARARLMETDAPLKAFAWSSWPSYWLVPSRKPDWLPAERLLGEYRIPKDSPAGRQELERALDAWPAEPPAVSRAKVRRRMAILKH
jgi:hypothetical protein